MRIRKLAEGLKAEEWQLDGEGSCGLPFYNVMTVIEPLGINPLITLRNPLGLNGIKQGIKTVEAERKKLGLRPATNKHN